MENAYLVAGIPNHHMLEYNANFNPLKEDVFKEPLVVQNGYIDLSNKPGFGLELAPTYQRSFHGSRVTPGSPILLCRRDSPVTGDGYICLKQF